MIPFKVVKKFEVVKSCLLGTQTNALVVVGHYQNIGGRDGRGGDPCLVGIQVG